MVRYIIVFIFIISFLIACNPANDSTNNTENTNDEELNETPVTEDNKNESTYSTEGPTTEDEQQSYMQEKLRDSYFTEVEIEVEYDHDQEYEVEIKEENGLIKAKIDDELKGRELKGIEAFDEIYKRMEEIPLTPTSDIDDIAEQILSLFNLPENYDEIEIEVKFHNGSELELEHKAHR